MIQPDAIGRPSTTCTSRGAGRGLVVRVYCFIILSCINELLAPVSMSALRLIWLLVCLICRMMGMTRSELGDKREAEETVTPR